ncbi:MAG: mechanosensitive ion channel family protein [Bdellovibrionia bacterium]
MNLEVTDLPFLKFFSDELNQILLAQHFLYPNWKWFAIGLILTVVLFLFPVFQWLLKKLRQKLDTTFSREDQFLHFYLKLRLERPLAGLVSLVIFYLSFEALKLTGRFHDLIEKACTVIAFWFIIRLAYFAVDALGSVFASYAAKTDSKMDDMLAPFLTKTLKVLVIILGALILLQSLGLNVISLLAGLGLGGLALALAAQDTAANIFGSITIFLDQPFKVGDWIKVQDVEGTVENIGFRSTQIRTFYNSLISIPNSVVAKEKIDNMGLRRLRRIRHQLGLTYSTSPAKIEEFCNNLRYVISQEPKVNKDNITIAFNGYGDSSLNILVNFHIEVETIQEELALQQRILLDILALSHQMQVEFAFPTRTVHMPTATSASL